MSNIVSGHFTASTAAVNVECGFVPDYIRAIAAIGGTEVSFEWFKVLYDNVVAAKGKYGFVVDAAAPAHVAAAINGFIPYDTSAIGVKVSSPVPGAKDVFASVSDWAKGTSYSTGERTATTIGTIVRPPTHNGFVYELTTDTGDGTSEPSSWPTVPGETCTDGGSNIWTCREEVVAQRGVKGFTVGATICTDGNEWVFKAEKHDRYTAMGDADSDNPVTFA